MKKLLENWIKTIKLQWILGGMFVYSLTILSGIYFFIQPQFEHYQKAIERQAAINDTYINLISLDIEAAIDSCEKQFDDLERLKARFRDRLLNNKSLNSVLPVIDRYCAESGLKVIKLEPLNKSVLLQPQYEKQFIETSLLGKYTDFLKLLQKLESHPGWILIESLTIIPVEKGVMSRFNVVLAVLNERTRA